MRQSSSCNPRLAFDALRIEEKFDVLLPCNVIVRETSDQRVEIASVDPVVSMERTSNPALAKTALDGRGRLARVVDSIGG
jgi:uncharacterized protein (DUF302 family)